eukprot:5682447-Pleurochrysis_carterae.AAC.1
MREATRLLGVTVLTPLRSVCGASPGCTDILCSFRAYPPLRLSRVSGRQSNPCSPVAGYTPDVRHVSS